MSREQVLHDVNFNRSREADHALSGALQEPKELRVSKLSSGLERSDRRKDAT